MPTITPLDCPKCGDSLKVTPELDRFTCPSCGTHSLVERQAGKATAVVDFSRQYPHPGPFPPHKPISRYAPIDQKFAIMGTLAGRRREEIEAVVGPPDQVAAAGNGLYVLVWSQDINTLEGGTITSRSYWVSLMFDSQGVCGGVVDEDKGQPMTRRVPGSGNTPGSSATGCNLAIEVAFVLFLIYIIIVLIM